MRGRASARRLAFGAIALCTAISLVAGAQPKKAAPAKTAPSKTGGPAKTGTKPGTGKKASDEADGGAAAPTREPREAKEQGETTKGAAADTKTLDGGQKVFRFGEVEVEGRLKSPQIVYFLRRVRAEFAASDLGHRSFMGELRETKNEPAF